MEGQVVELATVPHAFLRDVHLVEGQWIDAYVVALAEWGARLVHKGYVLGEPEDGHPFAWYRVLGTDGAETGVEVRKKMWEQAKKHLARFPGQTREIEGRQYFNWADYLKWRGRGVKGNLTSSLFHGLVLSQWNQWSDSTGKDSWATLSGMKVGELNCHANGYRYQVVDEQAEASRSREKLLSSIDAEKTIDGGELRLRSKAQKWREMAEGYVGELYALQVSFDSINLRYFDGQLGLFLESAHALSQLVKQAEKPVGGYNQNMAAEFELLDSTIEGSDARGSENRWSIDQSNLYKSTQRAATDQAAYLVDMAKAEALDAMGETERAVQLVDQHI